MSNESTKQDTSALALATGSAAWWLTGWRRKYRTLSATNHDDVCRVIHRLTAAEKRYRRENQMGEYAMPNIQDQPTPGGAAAQRKESSNEN